MEKSSKVNFFYDNENRFFQAKEKIGEGFYGERLKIMAHVYLVHGEKKSEKLIYLVKSSYIFISSKSLMEDYIILKDSIADFDFVILLDNCYVEFEARTAHFSTKSEKFSLKFYYKSTFDEWQLPIMSRCINTCFNDLYILKQLLGKGGYAHVYLTAQRNEGKPRAKPEVYAAKILQKERVVSEKNKLYILNELEIIRNLDHPGLATFYEIHETSNHIVFLFEYIPGKDLTSYLREGPAFEEGPALSLMAQLLDALSYLAKKNLVHRDVKPSNIMVNQTKDSLKLIDYGLTAKLNENPTTYPIILDRSGTVGYMAPEILSKNREYGIVTSKADVFSAGMVLLEM